jgi:hypothetical protein
MSQAIICTICGKKYPFKADLAGRKVKCRCGHVIAVPAPVVKADEDSLYQLAPDPSKEQSKGTVLPRQEEDDGSVPCPNCNSPVIAGSVICVACGFNLKTGEKLEGIGSPVRPAAPASGSGRPARFAGIPPGLSAKRVADEPRSAMFWKIGIVALVMLLIAGAVVAMRYVGRGSGATAAAALDPDDESVAEAMGGFHKEVRQWFKDHESAVFGGALDQMNARQAEAKVEEWYRLGAKQVIVFDPRAAIWVAIELPPEPEKRAALFEWQKKWHAERNQRIRTDNGQKYLVIRLGV